MSMTLTTELKFLLETKPNFSSIDCNSLVESRKDGFLLLLPVFTASFVCHDFVIL